MNGSSTTHLRIRSALLLALVVAATACRTAPPETGSTTSPATTTSTAPVDPRRPVIFDYSPTVSDLGALTFLATHSDVRLIAVTLPGTGESYCEPGVAHTRGVLIELGLGDVPVACGPDRTFGRYNSFPIQWRLFSNDIDLPEAEPNEARSAPDLIIDLLAASPTSVDIVAVGPLTNLAHVLTRRPDLIGRVAGITIMGGAVDVPGNVFRNPHGEWNIWVDPTAADAVLASGAPITLVPLDATNSVPTGPVFYEALISEPATTASRLVGELWTTHPDWIATDNGYFLWDELAAAVLVDESLVTFETRNLVVDDDNFGNEGWTREDPAGSPVRVAISADRLAFETLFLSTLFGRNAEPGYLEATPEELAYFDAVAEINRASSASIDALFAEASAEFGLTEDSTEEDFLGVVAIMFPRFLAGPLPEQTDRLAAITAPERLERAHAAFVAANRSLLESAGDAVTAFIAEPRFELLEPFLGPVEVACAAVQYEVGVRLLDIDLACFGG